NKEDMLDILDNWIVEYRGKKLEKVEKEIIFRTWQGDEYDKMADLGLSLDYIKRKKAPDLWKLFSEILGERVTKKNFKLITEKVIEKRLHSPQLFKAPQRQDWGDIPEVPIFYGRQDDLLTLKQWILTDSCRVVGVWGMAGMGKTALSVQLSQQLANQFQFVIWRSLHYPQSVLNILTDWLQFFSADSEILSPHTFPNLVSQLMDYLRNYRCLLVLDEVGSLFAMGQLAGKYRKEYQEYGYLFRLIAETKHQSCLLLISLEKSRELDLLDGDNYPVRYYKLKGLAKRDAKLLLREKGLADESELSSLIEQYEGNPLYLNIISGMILDLFNGKASDFLRKNATLLDEIKDLLNEYLQRLSKLEIEVMYQLAIASSPLNIDRIQQAIPTPVSASLLMEALKSLRGRSLVEKITENDEPLFVLSRIICQYILERFL
ncbi:MAG: NB-ARC domain-containing protein, partial [Planktothrix sp.]